MSDKSQGSFLHPGEHLFGKYRIEKVVGRGGYGRVYKARDTLMDRDVAVKELLLRYAGNPLVVRRFIQEARAAGKLQHANIITVYNLERAPDDGRFFLIMEYINGASVRQIVKKKPKLSVKHVKMIASSVLSGLEHAHNHLVVHRDIKPDNIMVTLDERIKIADFGVAKLPVTEGGFTQLTGAGMPAGTAAYLSPEQVKEGELTPATDLYSLGATLYELATGEFYFNVEGCKSFYEVQQAILETTPKRPSALEKRIPPWLDELILGLLIKDVSRRIQSAAEALALIEGLVSSSSIKDSHSAEKPVDKREHVLRPSKLSNDEAREIAADLSGITLDSIGQNSGAAWADSDRFSLPRAFEKISNLRWSFDTSHPVSQLIVHEGQLFVSTDGGPVYMVDCASGRELWRSVELSAGITASTLQTEIAVSGKYLASLGGQGKVVLYDWREETVLWEKSLHAQQIAALRRVTGEWDPRTSSRKHHLFWYGLPYLVFECHERSNNVVIEALEIADGGSRRLLSIDLGDLVSVVQAPRDAAELVEGHIWLSSKSRLVAADLLAGKVIKERNFPAEFEHLALYGSFQLASFRSSDRHRATSGITRKRKRKNGAGSGKSRGYYSSHNDFPILVSVERCGSTKFLSAVDIDSLEPRWTFQLSDSIAQVAMQGALEEVICSDFSVYAIADERRRTMVQLDICNGAKQGQIDFKESIIWVGGGKTGLLLMFQDGTIAEYSFEKNELLWSYRIDLGILPGMFVFSQDAIFAAFPKRIVAFE